MRLSTIVFQIKVSRVIPLRHVFQLNEVQDGPRNAADDKDGYNDEKHSEKRLALQQLPKK